MINVANTMANDEYQFINKCHDRACGQGHNDKNKKWILDIDEVGRKTNDIILYIEREWEPIGVKYITMIPSKNGFHLITKPFNLSNFHKIYPNIEICKDNPTNLFIP